MSTFTNLASSHHESIRRLREIEFLNRHAEYLPNNTTAYNTRVINNQASIDQGVPSVICYQIPQSSPSTGGRAPSGPYRPGNVSEVAMYNNSMHENFESDKNIDKRYATAPLDQINRVLENLPSNLPLHQYSPSQHSNKNLYRSMESINQDRQTANVNMSTQTLSYKCVAERSPVNNISSRQPTMLLAKNFDLSSTSPRAEVKRIVQRTCNQNDIADTNVLNLPNIYNERTCEVQISQSVCPGGRPTERAMHYSNYLLQCPDLQKTCDRGYTARNNINIDNDELYIDLTNKPSQTFDLRRSTQNFAVSEDEHVSVLDQVNSNAQMFHYQPITEKLPPSFHDSQNISQNITKHIVCKAPTQQVRSMQTTSIQNPRFIPIGRDRDVQNDLPNATSITNNDLTIINPLYQSCQSQELLNTNQYLTRPDVDTDILRKSPVIDGYSELRKIMQDHSKLPKKNDLPLSSGVTLNKTNSINQPRQSPEILAAKQIQITNKDHLDQNIPIQRCPKRKSPTRGNFKIPYLQNKNIYNHQKNTDKEKQEARGTINVLCSEIIAKSAVVALKNVETKTTMELRKLSAFSEREQLTDTDLTEQDALSTSNTKGIPDANQRHSDIQTESSQNKNPKHINNISDSYVQNIITLLNTSISVNIEQSKTIELLLDEINTKKNSFKTHVNNDVSESKKFSTKINKITKENGVNEKNHKGVNNDENKSTSNGDNTHDINKDDSGDRKSCVVNCEIETDSNKNNKKSESDGEDSNRNNADDTDEDYTDEDFTDENFTDEDYDEDYKKSDEKYIGSDDTDDDDSDEDEDYDYKEHEPSIKKRRRSYRRPFILPAEYDANDARWTLKHRQKGPGLVELEPNSGVLINYIDLIKCKSSSKNYTTLARNLLTAIFTESALSVCSLKGGTYTSSSLVRPGLHDHAMLFLIEYVKKHGLSKDWGTFECRFLLDNLRNTLQKFRKARDIEMAQNV